MSLLSNPMVIGLIVGLPASVFGFLAYRRSEKLDDKASQVAVIAIQGEGVQRVIDGLDRIVINLQTDNKEARELAADLTRRLKECGESYDRLKRITHTQYDEGGTA